MEIGDTVMASDLAWVMVVLQCDRDFLVAKVIGLAVVRPLLPKRLRLQPSRCFARRPGSHSAVKRLLIVGLGNPEPKYLMNRQHRLHGP